MSLSSEVSALATRIATEFKSIRTAIAGKANTSHTHVATTDLTATGTKDATTYLRGDDTWATPPSGGSGGTSGENLATTTDYAGTTPTSPTTGLVWFTRHRARRMAAAVGPAGYDTVLQSSLAFNRIYRYIYQWNAIAPQQDALPTPTSYTAGTAVIPNATDHFTQFIRTRYSTTATAGTLGGIRVPTAQWFRSSTPNMGGFHLVVRAGFSAPQNNSRAYIGFYGGTTALTNVEPSTLNNICGFSLGASQANWQFITRAASGTATQTDTGFAARTANVMYEFSLFAASGNSTEIFWSLRRLSDGAISQGVHTTTLPALNTYMAPHVFHTNNTTAALASLDLSNFFIEVDN